MKWPTPFMSTQKMCEGAYTKQPGNAKKKKTHAMDYAHAPAKTERTDHMQVTQTLEYGERIVCHACRKKKADRIAYWNHNKASNAIQNRCSCSWRKPASCGQQQHRLVFMEARSQAQVVAKRLRKLRPWTEYDHVSVVDGCDITWIALLIVPKIQHLQCCNKSRAHSNYDCWPTLYSLCTLCLKRSLYVWVARCDRLATRYTESVELILFGGVRSRHCFLSRFSQSASYEFFVWRLEGLQFWGPGDGFSSRWLVARQNAREAKVSGEDATLIATRQCGNVGHAFYHISNSAAPCHEGSLSAACHVALQQVQVWQDSLLSMCESCKTVTTTC